MKRRLLLWVVPLLAQSPPAARIYVAGAPQPMIAGSSVKLSAAVRDAAGNVIPNAPLTWTSLNPSAFTIDTQGVLKAVGLGVARIRVASGNARTEFDANAVPLRVEIDPASANMLTGDRYKFTARALDVNRQPIAGALVEWFVENYGYPANRSVTVDAGGVVNAPIAGRFRLRASIGGIWGYATLRVDPKPSYRLTRVFSNDPIPGPHTFTGAAGPAVFSESGQFALSANLNDWARQVLLWDNGRFHPLAAVGETNWDSLVTHFSFRGSNLMLDTRVGGITSRGEVLLCCSDLLVATRDKVRSVLMANTWLGTARYLWRFGTGRRSINEAGEIAFTAGSFQYVGSNTILRGVFKLFQNRLTIVWTSDRPLEGLTGDVSAVNPMIDGRGTVYFVATAGSTSGLYASNGNSPAKRILGPGDSVADEQIAGVSGEEMGAIVNENGDVAVAVTLAGDKRAIVRIRAGGEPRLLPNPGAPLVYAINASGAVLFDNGGLHLWEADETRPVLPHEAEAPDGGTVAAIVSAGLTNGGDIYAQVRTHQGGTIVMKIDGPVYLKTGDPVDTSAPVALHGLSLMRGGSFPRLRLGTGSLFELRPSGLEPLILSRDTPEGVRGDDFVDAGPQGIYFASPRNRLFRRTESGYEAVTAIDGPIDRFAVNWQGHAAVVSNQRLYFFDGGATAVLADGSTEAPGGGTFASWQQIVLDGRDRVLALATTSEGASGLFLHDGAWSSLVVLGQTRFPGGAGIVTAAPSIRANQDRFFALLVDDRGGVAVASFRDGDWASELRDGDPLPASPQGVGGILAFDVNQRGDILLRVFADDDEILLRSGSALKLVINSTIAVDGAYFNSRNSIDSLVVQDDGTVYLAGLDQFGRYIIVRADPL
jgi:hypothetical protein